jgi:hypothetical protein
MKHKISPNNSDDIKIEKKLFRWQIYTTVFEFSQSDSFFSSGGWYIWRRATLLGFKTKEEAMVAAKKNNKLEYVAKYLVFGIVIFALGATYFIFSLKENAIDIVVSSLTILCGGVITFLSISFPRRIKKIKMPKLKEKMIFSDGYWKTINE